MELLNSENTRSLPTVARALGKLGDARVIEPMVRLLERPEKEIQVEAINALARLADDKRADSVRSYIQAAGANATDETIQQRRDARAGGDRQPLFEHGSRGCCSGRRSRSRRPKMAEPARTLLIEKGDVDQVIKKAEETAATRRQDGHRHAQERRHHRRPLQVHREDRQGRVRHGACWSRTRSSTSG